MAKRIEPPLRSPKSEHPSQPARQLYQEAPAAPTARQNQDMFRFSKTITFVVSVSVVGFLIYQKPSLDEPILAWAKNMVTEIATTFTALKNSTQTAFGGTSEEAIATNAPQENRTSQSDWISEARNNFFQLSASDRARIQKWLADNYEYNGALDGLWGPRTESSFLRASSTHRDIDRLFMTAFRETPAIRQVSRPPTPSSSTANAQQDLQSRIMQLRALCSIQSRGSLGERMVDQDLYMLTGERCARPPPVFQPIAPIQPNLPTRCTPLPRWSHLPPSLANLEIYCQ